ncbi:MAG: ABC transporter permease [Rhodanobacter sp. 68-29]|nr:ABC transporter permease [Rhodanobacter sp.]ODV27940.1 MAG: ABC transporter permease [Rhodanobacter sp. SCN 68-63]OJY60644.1 MAG: ABC transporter permease [Rhodanobacter sp. 68-29]
MNTVAAVPVNAAASAMPPGRVLGAYLAEARSECLRYLRAPSFVLPMTLFSTVFYLMFGVLLNHPGSNASHYLLASYTAFGVMGPGLFGFGASLAIEREGGLLTLKRSLPMPPGAYLIGKMAMAMVVAALVVLLLLALGLTVGGVSLSPPRVLAMLAIGVLGVLPFCALGMFVGTLIKGQGAPGLLNLVYLPMAFLSGLWLPLGMLPKVLQQIAPVWPSYHLNQLTQSAVGLRSGPLLPHVLALLAFAVVFLLLAARRLRRYG